MNKLKIFIMIFLLLSLLFSIMNTQKTKEFTVIQTVENVIEEENNIIIEEQKEEIQSQEQEKEKIIPETYTTMYAKVKLHIRQEADINSKIVNTVNINTELQTVDSSGNGEWTKIKIDDNYYYVASKFLSNEQVKIKIEEPKSKSNYISNSNTGVLTKSKGVNYFNGHRETWYSQKVLPGGGLNIPGRHVDDRGLICDGDGYICVASNDYTKGTIVETSLGTGKVYDCGCPSGTIDIYTNW